MPNKNITKFAFIVILMGSMALSQTGCSIVSPSSSTQNDGFDTPRYGNPVVTGTLQSKDLREASGVAASKCQADVYWTHNDSGDDALVYAINGKGEHLGVWKIADARNKDWEDIAAFRESSGECSLLIGDIGNNELKRDDLTIYRVAEPAVAADSRTSSKNEPLAAASARSLSFSYPSAAHDAEALLVHPVTGDIYILTKSRSMPSVVYRIKPEFDGQSQTAARVAEVKVPAVPNGTITGGDISPDGRKVVLCDYFAGYELKLPDGAADFDEVWAQKPIRIDLGEREIGEAVAYTQDGSAVIALSEKRNAPVIFIESIAK